MLADEVDYAIGVDTHRDQHTIAVVVAPTGAVLSQTVISANGGGYAQALRFADDTRAACASGRSKAPVLTALA